MNKSKMYPLWFLLPALIIYVVFFMIPMIVSVPLSFTTFDFESIRFTGLENYKIFFTEHSLNIGIKNSIIYALVTTVFKVAGSFLLALILTGNIQGKTYIKLITFFPQMVSTIAIGMVFSSMLHPTKGVINQALASVGLNKVDWLGNPNIALWTVMFVDIWKGLGYSTVIFLASILSIDKSYIEASKIDGANFFYQVTKIIIPLTRPARNTVIILSLIGGLRSFDLVWTLTGGGPGFATDVLPSIIYKQYAAGFYGLSTAGNVVLLVFIAILVFPLQKILNLTE